ncbi:MAG: hypothetical protein DRO67_10410 [Candidatus Asgardarchaeum californiense]|nr:MAG: hypothetical protein DRO67_10410 [Candidatus Asgardarchaeum californiense]
MFIPRHPVVENQFCSYGAQSATASAGVGGVVCYAGAVVFLDASATNEEPIVYKMAYNASPYTPFGFAMQKVKTGYHQVHPTGFTMPGDLGSSDVIAQPDYDASGNITGTKEIPMGVAHLGIWDTVHYTCVGGTTPSVKMSPGIDLFAAADEGKVTNSTVNANGTDTVGERASDVVVAKVMKGVSLAKASANINNTTLYPIRIKLLI